VLSAVAYYSVVLNICTAYLAVTMQTVRDRPGSCRRLSAIIVQVVQSSRKLSVRLKGTVRGVMAAQQLLRMRCSVLLPGGGKKHTQPTVIH
jgi:hypothetical protein